jgi:hypothetical protein
MQSCAIRRLARPRARSSVSRRGYPTRAPACRKYFVEANNSLHEVVAAVDLAAAIGAIGPAVADEIIDLSGRLKPMIRALLR